jgi:general secretion pathway protein N
MTVRSRRRRPSVLLFLLCLGLGYALYAGLTSAPEDAGVVVPVAAGPQPAAAVPTPAGFAMPPLGDFSETVARPLFLPSRRPLFAEGEGPQQAATVERNLFSLMGVIISADERMALVARRKTGEVLRLIEGQQVDGWTVDAILPDHISLRHGNETDELVLRDAPRPEPKKEKRERARKRPRSPQMPSPGPGPSAGDAEPKDQR